MYLSQDQPEGLAEEMSDNPDQRSNAEVTFHLWRIYLVDWYDYCHWTHIMTYS